MPESDFQIPTPDSSTTNADRAEIHGELPTGFGQLLWHMLRATATKYPEREAIVSLQSGSVKDSLISQIPSQRWTYQHLITKVNEVAHRLGHLGCGGAGNSLVVVTRNIAEWGLFFWVAAKLGMAFVPLDPSAKDEFGALLLASAPQVLVVEDHAMAQRVDDWAVQTDRSISTKIMIAGSLRTGWLSLPQIQAESHRLCQMKCQFDGLRAGGTSSPALVIFTSGTTGAPKGCIHTHDNVMSQTHDYDPNPDPDFVDRWLVHTPVHHIFAINNALRAWRVGSAVILPAPTFTVDSSLRALVEEQCTIMSVTPTLVRALLSHPDFPGASQLSLTVVSLASTMISAEDIRLCKESLGCRDAIQAYGMSESGPLASWSRQDPLLVDGFHTGVGKVLPGASIRICHPGTQDVLRMGDIGEVHVSGTSVIGNYLANDHGKSFYTDEGRRWLVTGDQARIDEEGVVYVLGRYKDLIIRGGENIDPTVIENSIATISNIEVSFSSNTSLQKVTDTQ